MKGRTTCRHPDVFLASGQEGKHSSTVPLAICLEYGSYSLFAQEHLTVIDLVCFWINCLFYLADLNWINTENSESDGNFNDETNPQNMCHMHVVLKNTFYLHYLSPSLSHTYTPLSVCLFDTHINTNYSNWQCSDLPLVEGAEPLSQSAHLTWLPSVQDQLPPCMCIPNQTGSPCWVCDSLHMYERFKMWKCVEMCS